MAQPAAPSGAPNRADYGDESTAPTREHPAIGVLRGVYRDIEKAITTAGGATHVGVPKAIEVELRRAQAIVIDVAGRLKEGRDA